MAEPDLEALLDAAGFAPTGEEPFIPMSGPNHYQVRADLPGGAILLAGASGRTRDRVRGDMARLLGVEERHLAVAKIGAPGTVSREAAVARYLRAEGGSGD